MNTAAVEEVSAGSRYWQLALELRNKSQTYDPCTIVEKEILSSLL